MFEEAATLSIGELKRYRAWVSHIEILAGCINTSKAFPSALSDRSHDPFLNLRTATQWMTSIGYQTFLLNSNSGGADAVDPASATMDQIDRYRTEILGPMYRDHPFFDVDSLEEWINPGTFGVFLRCYAQESGVDTLQTHDSESAVPTSPASSFCDLNSTAGSRGSLVPASRPASSMSIHSTSSFYDGNYKSRPQSSLSMAPSESFDPDIAKISEPDEVSVTSKRSGQFKGKSRVEGVRITSHQSVNHLVPISVLPRTWDIPNPPKSTAYLFHAVTEADRALLKNEDGTLKPLGPLIRKEDQDSWDTKSGGHASATGDVSVSQLLPHSEETVRCRRITMHCNGLDMCSRLDPSLLSDDYRRFSADPSESHALWAPQMQANANEASSYMAGVARCYRHAIESKCKISCDGNPKLIKFSGGRTIKGHTHFIGCSKFQSTERNQHRYYMLPDNVEFELIKHALENDGQLPNVTVVNNLCSFTSNPRFGTKTCGSSFFSSAIFRIEVLAVYSHIINGTIFRSPMVRRKCDAKMIILVPTTDEQRKHPEAQLGYKAIIYFLSPHNHPAWPVSKMGSSEKQRLSAAINTIGVRGLTASKLLKSNVLTDAFGTAALGESSTALLNMRNVRHEIKSYKKQEFRYGTGWEGGQTFKLAPFYPEATCRAIILDGEAAQALGLGEFLKTYNVPSISGIDSCDPIELLSYCLKTCVVHFDRHAKELAAKDVPRHVIDRIREFPYLDSQMKIDEWISEMPDLVEPFPAANNWLKHKLNNRWIFPSLNQVLSWISFEDYKTIPNHSNLAESSHAARNAETEIHVGLLDAILDAQARDNIHAANLCQMELSGVLHKRGNDTYHREVNSVQRAMWQKRVTDERNMHIQDFQSLQNELEEGKSENNASLERSKGIKAEIQQCNKLLQEDRRSEHVSHRLKQLRAEEKAEMETRRAWKIRRAEIDANLQELRAGPLACKQIPARSKTSTPALAICESPSQPSTSGMHAAIDLAPSANGSNSEGREGLSEFSLPPKPPASFSNNVHLKNQWADPTQAKDQWQSNPWSGIGFGDSNDHQWDESVWMEDADVSVGAFERPNYVIENTPLPNTSNYPPFYSTGEMPLPTADPNSEFPEYSAEEWEMFLSNIPAHLEATEYSAGRDSTEFLGDGLTLPPPVLNVEPPVLIAEPPVLNVEHEISGSHGGTHISTVVETNEHPLRCSSRTRKTRRRSKDNVIGETTGKRPRKE
ncbi:unnamed protein product [Mycena citricolor]|uniref:Uncharacterized protein n=1 Tax=Mycena citricolor TaxID=2018698 RepID=A0AAD2HAC3_9AGAR|nr:unnamed protein product [Mycena citricolor]